MIAYIIALFMMLCLFLALTIWSFTEGVPRIVRFLLVCITGLYVGGFIEATTSKDRWKDSEIYKEGQIDAFKGKWRYEQQFIYRANDTIPIDTIYVEIEPSE